MTARSLEGFPFSRTASARDIRLHRSASGRLTAIPAYHILIWGASGCNLLRLATFAQAVRSAAEQADRRADPRTLGTPLRNQDSTHDQPVSFLLDSDQRCPVPGIRPRSRKEAWHQHRVCRRPCKRNAAQDRTVACRWAIDRRYGLLWLAFCQLDSKLSDRDICSQGGEYAMIRPKLISAALLFVTAGSMTSGASAITVELAKKCEAPTPRHFLRA
jgi:hypothetical protein